MVAEHDATRERSPRLDTETRWPDRSPGRPPWPLPAALLLAPPLLLWTLPQSLVGLAACLLRCLQGHRPRLYRFGPFPFLVIRARGPMSSGISLGLFVFSETPGILKHEFCHLFTALWLCWLYLPAYGIEYALFGHDRSPHERLTCRLERTVDWGYRC
jgi:hypothetical protein